jgi:hypothetical protein
VPIDSWSLTKYFNIFCLYAWLTFIVWIGLLYSQSLSSACYCTSFEIFMCLLGPTPCKRQKRQSLAANVNITMEIAPIFLTLIHWATYIATPKFISVLSNWHVTAKTLYSHCAALIAATRLWRPLHAWLWWPLSPLHGSIGRYTALMVTTSFLCYDGRNTALMALTQLCTDKKENKILIFLIYK